MSHVLIKALVEIKEKCMAGGEWGVAPLLQKSNFCEPKRPNNFCNVNRSLSIRPSQGARGKEILDGGGGRGRRGRKA